MLLLVDSDRACVMVLMRVTIIVFRTVVALLKHSGSTRGRPEARRRRRVRCCCCLRAWRSRSSRWWWSYEDGAVMVAAYRVACAVPRGRRARAADDGQQHVDNNDV